MIAVNEERLLKDFRDLARIGNSERGLNRIPFTHAYEEGRAFVKRLMEDAEMCVRIDPVGNIYGRYDGINQLRPFLVGSHLDSVPDGSIYYGVLGVIAGIEALRSLKEQFGALPAPIEAAGFIAEEANAFGGTFGSRHICQPCAC